ncbi:MAG: trigger factor [Acutalibacteraceae bacterium]
MSLKSTKEVETNRHELEVQVDGDTFQKAINNVFRKKSKNINIPGFRKGKAPKSIIEKMYGKEVFYDDAMQDLYPEALADAAKEAGLEIINDKIDLDVVEVGDDGFTFKAVVTVKPTIDVNNYKGIEVTAKSTEVTDEILEQEIQNVRERNSRLVTVEDRPVQNDDLVVIDFEGFVDGVAFEGGKAENYNLKIGSGSFIPGFEDQIIGHITNDEFTITVKFPEDYQVEELKAKDADFKIVLHEIKERQLPDFDEEFVKDVSDKETIDEYKEELKGEVAQRLQKESENDVENQITDKLVELLEGEVPQAMFTNEVNEMLREFDMRLRQQGMDLNTYMQYTGMNIETLAGGYREQAEKRVKLRLILEKIAEKEAIEVSDEDVENEYARLAETYKMEVEQVKNAISHEDLAKDLSVEKAMQLVKDSAKIA